MSRLVTTVLAPNDWTLRPLRYLADLNPETLPESHPTDAPIHYIDIGNVGRGIMHAPPDSMPFGRTPSRARRVVRDGDILVSTVRTYLRAVIRLAGVEDGTVASTGFAAIRPTSEMDGRFLYYWCLSNPFVETVVAKSKGVSYPEVNASDLLDIPVPVPSLDVQCRVADMLDIETARIDTLIAKNNEAAALNLRRRNEALARAVAEGLDGAACRRSGLDWAPVVATGFDVGAYQYLARIGTGHTPSRSHPSLWTECKIPWVTTGDVKRLRPGRRETLSQTAVKISADGLRNSAAVLHSKGTVFLSRTASVGFSGIMGTNMATSQDFFTWTCGPRLHPKYLLYVLRSMKSRGQFDRMMYGSTHKTIYFPNLMQLRGPVPPLAEQRRIADHCSDVVGRSANVEDRMRQLNELLRVRRQSLITAAVTGQIIV